MLTFSDFILFLYEEKCLVNYFDNVKNYVRFDKEDDIKSRIKKLMKCRPINYLNCSFIWTETKENFDFWMDINNKWLCFIDNER